MAINLYKPWWIHTSDPLDIEEKEPVIPEGMMALDEIASLIEQNMPDLWDKASEFDITRFEKTQDPQTGKSITQFPYQWTEEQKQVLQNPAERAAYLLDQYPPLAPLKEKSALHNLNIGFFEKWRYSVDEAFESAGAIGVPAVIASITKTAGARKIKDTIDSFTDHANEGYERDFGKKEDSLKEDDMIEVDGELVPKSWVEPASDSSGLFFETPEEKELYTKEYKKYIDAVNNEKEKDVPDKETFRVIDRLNSWAEETAIRNIKKLEERRSKDLRYQAWQEYASQKPVGWFETVQTPEYVVDLALGMVPSVAVMGAAVATAGGGGALAAVGVGTIGHFPLEATGQYTEAYNWTMENTGDEELAKSNAAWSTAEYLTFVAATESLGVMRLFNRIIPKSVRNSAKVGPFRKLYKKNIATPERISELKNLKETIPGKGVGYMYRALRDPFAEGLQEYVQYVGSVLSEAGYKGESRDIASILRGDHPLVDDKEVQQSVIGGALFGAGFGLAGYAGSKWSKSNNKANTILNDEYGIETGIPNADLSEKSLFNIPTVIGDAEPNLENYVKELLNPQRSERVIVDRKRNTKSPFSKLIYKQDKYTKSSISEKLSEAILEGGQKSWDSLDSSLKEEINQHLKGAVSNLNEDILNIVSDKDNLAQDILNKKISIDTKKIGTSIQSTKNRKIKVRDKEYIDNIVKLYEKEISESLGEEATPTSTKNYLAREYNIDVEKQLQKDIKKSIQKSVKGGVSASIQKEAEKVAERQVQEQIEQEALKQLKKKKGLQQMPEKGQAEPEVEQSVIGQKALIDKGKFKGKSGEIISYSPKQQLVKLKLEDGTKTPAIKVSQVALTQMPTEQVQKPVPKKEIIQEEKPSKVLKPTPATVKKPVDNKTKLENRYSSLLARRKIIVKNKGNTNPIDREIARVKKQIGDDRKVEDVFVEDKPKEKTAQDNKINQVVEKLTDKQSKEFESEESISLKVEAKLYEKYDLYDENGDLPPENELIKIETISEDYKADFDWTSEKFSITEKAKEILNKKELKELQLNVDRVNKIEEQANEEFKKIEEEKGEIKGQIDKNTKKLKSIKKEEKVLDKKIEKVKKEIKEKEINPIIKAEMKIKELSEMEGVTIERAPTGPGYENRIGNIEVDEKLRGQGLGTQIVDAFKDLFKAKDKTKIEIIARPGSEDFWLKQGFEKYGESSELVENENGDMVKPDKMRFWLKERPIKQEAIDIDETVQEDAANLSRAIENFSSQPKAFQYFDAAYKKIKDKYGIDVSDFVPAMHKSLKVIENKEQRDMVRNLLSEWAVSVDPSISTKMRDNNDAFKIVELFGLSGAKKKRIQSQISDLNVIDNIVNTLDKQGAEHLN
jgi:predicted GNAT family N-acyltransferase